MTQLFTNNGVSTLSANITNVATSIVLTTGGGAKFPNPTAPDFFYATIFQVASGVESNWEVVKVTARATDTLTVVRAQQGTTALAFNSLDPIQLRWTKPDADISVLPRPHIRQTVLAGAISSGLPAFFAAGTGLALNLSATSVALQIAFASGFGANGAVDHISQLTADVTGFISSLAANNTSYLTATYVDAATVTWGKTLAPPQYGYAYDRTKQAVLQFGGAAGSTTFLDDYGNTWTAVSGAKVQTNQFKFGTGGLGGGGVSNILNGTTDFIKTTNITSLGLNGWSVRAWGYVTAMPAASAGFNIFNLALGATGAMHLQIVNTAGVTKWKYYLSTTGASYDIANGVNGTTALAINTWYFVELTFDVFAGAYRLYVNGVQEAITGSTATVATGAGMSIGAVFNGSGNFWAGYIDKPEFLPYCDHPNGTTYTVPAAAPSVTAAGYSSDFFSIPKMQMLTVSAASSAAGTDPTFTVANKVYAGEVDTLTTTVTAVRNYAYQGKYVSALLAAPASTSGNSGNHNLGLTPSLFSIFWVCKITDAGYIPGTVISITTMDNATIAYTLSATGKSVWYLQGNSPPVVSNWATGARTALTAASWSIGFSASRGWGGA